MNSTTRYRRRILLLAAAAAAAATTPAHGQYTSGNRDVLIPNTGIWPSGGVTLGGTTFINRGLQGVGYISASMTDPVTGESVGSISDMQISGWRKTDSGYAGTFNFLPDRGYNSGAVFSNYGARINTFDFSFTPYVANGILTPPNSTTHAASQISTTFTGSTLFTYDHDNNPLTAAIPTTGLVPTSVGTFAGQNIPVVAASTTTLLLGGSTVANRLTMDAEGLVFDPRPGKAGSGWVSDEYGGNIYHFNASKQIDGVLGIPDALVPHSPAGTINYAVTPTNGRRDNQGFEGLSLTPDGTRLFALLQSATIQDSASGNQGRANAVRLLEYDVSGNSTPTTPAREFVIQLPRIDDTGSAANGTTVNRAGAQSSIIAINDHQLLILSRDGNGRGASGSAVFKSILLADLNGATDIKGASLDAEGGATTSPAGTLKATITPIAWTEALNLVGKLDLSVTELEQFGFNFNTAPGDLNTLSEKWEALAMVPALDPAAPDDYFVFVGNDNDFLTASVKMYDANGTLQTYTSAIENDNVVLAFRVTAVPEASTWGAGMAAFVAAGSFAWRRRFAKS